MANKLKNLSASVIAATAEAMRKAGEDICEGMRNKLTAAGHIDTGALRDSIRQETEVNGSVITTRIYADAQSEDGAMYAEFIELGTGAAHGREGGRVGTWRYQDRNGNWHTTDGMDADPFIQPSVDEVIPRLGDYITNTMYDIAKYGRMRQND